MKMLVIPSHEHTWVTPLGILTAHPILEKSKRQLKLYGFMSANYNIMDKNTARDKLHGYYMYLTPLVLVKLANIYFTYKTYVWFLLEVVSLCVWSFAECCDMFWPWTGVAFPHLIFLEKKIWKYFWEKLLLIVHKRNAYSLCCLV